MSADPHQQRGNPTRTLARAGWLALLLHALLLVSLDQWWRRDGDVPARTATITVQLAPRAAPQASTRPAIAPGTPVPPLPGESQAVPAPERPARPPAPPFAATELRPPAAPAEAMPTATSSTTAASPAGATTPSAQADTALPSALADPATAAPGGRIVLFAPDGRLRVPTAVLEGEPPPVPSWIAAPNTPAPWEQRADPLVYQASAFEPIWKPDRESVLDEFVRLNTRTRTFKTPWGSKVTCSWVLIAGGCAW